MISPNQEDVFIRDRIIPVTKAYLPNKQKYISYVDQIFQSGWLTNNGSLLREFEIKLGSHLKVKNVICVANGTLALQLAYKALGLKGEVITTPFSFPATTSTLVWEGLKPVFADINPETLNLDPGNVESAITSDTSCIVPVHVFGNPCEVEVIQKIAEKYSLKVVYDAAHSLGTNYTDINGNTESILNYGDISTLSFHSTKLLHTIEGGAIVTNNDELAKKIRLLMNFGISGVNTVASLGINAKMNEFQAAMGLCILDDIKSINMERSRIFNLYKRELDQVVSFQSWNPSSRNNYSYAPILFNSEKSLLAVESKLNDLNVFPRRYFYPSLDTLNYLNKPSSIMYHSQNISSRILCLPIFPWFKVEDQLLVINTIKDHFNNANDDV